MDGCSNRRQWIVGAAATLWGCGGSVVPAKEPKPEVVSFQPGDLIEYGRQPKAIQGLIKVASDLTRRKLGYTFGSNDPDRGGMDCSGTISHTLSAVGIVSPRSSFDQYHWAKKAGTLHELKGKAASLADPAFGNLRPGDLLFWEGTYETGARKPPISHVMIYLGILAADRLPVLFGASDGRHFRGRRIRGVSAFDFDLPSPKSTSRFVAYGAAPGLR
jgi:hypothetical protein